MTLDSYKGQERRRYFRVTDLVSLECTPVSAAEVEIENEHFRNRQAVLRELNDAIAAQIERVRHQSVEVAKLAELIDQKLNFCIQDDQQLAPKDLEMTEVNLSACGIAFVSDESYAVNQHLALEITLYPSHVHLSLLAAVIHCAPHESSNLIRADFVNLSDAQQELLVQHVIKRQSKQLQSERGEP